MIKRQGVYSTIDWCLDNTIQPKYLQNIDKLELSKFALSIKDFLNQDLHIRTEGSHFNIFCQDQLLFDQLIQNLMPWIKGIYSPANGQELKAISQHGNTIHLCNQLPYDQYQFKVSFRSTIARNTKENFLSWAKNIGNDRIKISKSTVNWLENSGSRWFSGPFMYVSNRKDLMMVELFLGQDIKEVTEYIPRSHINKCEYKES